MKKKIEAELISIAHRVLKLKNRSETIVLHEEVKKLYEQLTVLRFYEEHILIAEKEISRETLEEKLQHIPVAVVANEEVAEEEVLLPETKTEIYTNEVEEEVNEEVILSEPETQVHTNDVEKEEEEKEKIIPAAVVPEYTAPPQHALFEGIDVANYVDSQFIKVEDVPKEVAQVADLTFEAAPEPIFEQKEPLAPVTLEVPKEEIKIEKIPEVIFEEPKTKSLNDRLNGTISFGLNDRIAFEKRLFGGNPDDFNRVVSQINTFDSFQEVQEFITQFVKPDYDNWDGKEEYETRFLEIIEKKFN